MAAGGMVVNGVFDCLHGNNWPFDHYYYTLTDNIFLAIYNVISNC